MAPRSSRAACPPASARATCDADAARARHGLCPPAARREYLTESGAIPHNHGRCAIPNLRSSWSRAATPQEVTVLATLDPIDSSARSRALPVTAAPAARDADPPALRIDESSLLSLLTATVDEIDYGLLLIARSQHVVHANHAARVELD